MVLRVKFAVSTTLIRLGDFGPFLLTLDIYVNSRFMIALHGTVEVVVLNGILLLSQSEPLSKIFEVIFKTYGVIIFRALLMKIPITRLNKPVDSGENLNNFLELNRFAHTLSRISFCHLFDH